ncbi:MAG: hypothetical protein H0T76_02920 [Nannocystis sp.]|nr:hypothetical protein [Nannocystis sp.]MBA3545413.1 hypothetical protein [Nannocystis sp.]
MLGLRIDRLAALAGGSLALTGCPGGGQDTDSDTETSTDSSGDSSSDPTTLNPTTDPPPPPPPPVDNTPPALVAIEFLDPQILRLTFTEAIAPVDQVNPKRFRLSVGNYRSADYYGYSRTLYFEPAQFNAINYCDYNCYDEYDCYYPCYNGPPTPVDVIDVLPDAVNPAQAVLLLAQPILPSLCQAANAQAGNPDLGMLGGLLLHYADGGQAQITDLVGLPLAPRGKTWVVQDPIEQLTVNDVQFPEMAPLLPVPCPL